MTIEGRQLTYSDLKTKVTHQALLVRTLLWSKRIRKCHFNTSAVGISEGKSGRKGRFQTKF